MSSFPQSSTTVLDWMECYNVVGKPYDDDPCDIHIPEYEGSQVVEVSRLSNEKKLNPLKTKKVNIWNPKMTI